MRVFVGNSTLAEKNIMLYSAHPAERVCRLLASEHQSNLLTKYPNYHSISAQELLGQVDVPDFLQNLRNHPDFRDQPGLTNGLTKFDFWDSVQVRIPTSEFVPEPRAARLYAISGLTNPRAKKKLAKPKRRSDAVLYHPSSNNINHESSVLQGMFGLLIVSSNLAGLLLTPHF